MRLQETFYQNITTGASPNVNLSVVKTPDLHLAWHSNVDRDIESATLRNSEEIVRRLNFGLEKATVAVESWVLQSGGRMVQSGGVDGQAVIPSDHLDEVLDVLRRYQEDTEASVACGVGVEPAEALTALTVARKRGGDPAIVLYSAEVAQEADEDQDGELDPILDSETDALEGNSEPAAPVPNGSMAKAQFGAEPSAGEATKIQQGALSASAAQPSAPSPVSPPPAPPADPNAQQPGQPAPQGGGDELIQKVGQVLMDVKKQLPTLEKMKAENPAAYESILAMTQAVIALAQKLTGGGVPGGAPVQKSEVLDLLKREMKEVLVEVDEREAQALIKLLQDIRSSANIGHSFSVVVDPEEKGGRKYGIDGDGCFYIGSIKFQGEEVGRMAKAAGVLHPPAPLKPTPSGHHELHLPVGSTRNHRVKVVHADGRTSWVEVKAGQITSEDGHPISSLNPGGR